MSDTIVTIVHQYTLIELILYLTPSAKNLIKGMMLNSVRGNSGCSINLQNGVYMCIAQLCLAIVLSAHITLGALNSAKISSFVFVLRYSSALVTVWLKCVSNYRIWKEKKIPLLRVSFASFSISGKTVCFFCFWFSNSACTLTNISFCCFTVQS